MNNKYTHKLGHKILSLFFIATLAFVSMSLGVLSIISIYKYLTEPIFIETTNAIGHSSILIFFSVATLLMGVAFFSRYSDIELMEDGVRVQVLPFWWVFIDWEEMIAIHPILPFFHTYAVVVHQLTLFHRLLGMMYLVGLFYGFKPVFLIGPTMHHHDELVAIITNKIPSTD